MIGEEIRGQKGLLSSPVTKVQANTNHRWIQQFPSFRKSVLYIFFIFFLRHVVCSKPLFIVNCKSEVSHYSSPLGAVHRGLNPFLFTSLYKKCVGYLTSHITLHEQGLWDGVYGFTSLLEKTRHSYYLQMTVLKVALPPQLFKNPGVSPAWIWTRDLPLSIPGLIQLSKPGGRQVKLSRTTILKAVTGCKILFQQCIELL